MGKNQDPGSGINIPDPQHCCFLILQFFAIYRTLHALSSGVHTEWRLRISGVGTFLHDGKISAGIFKQSMGARNRVGIGLSYRTARLHSGIGSLESILGLLKSLKIQTQPWLVRVGGGGLHHLSAYYHHVQSCCSVRSC
jgi:hypothetical protein